jgi:hypothetical protein
MTFAEKHRNKSEKYYSDGPSPLFATRPNNLKSTHHDATLDVSAFADDVTVPSFSPRMVCTRCGAIGADSRPN